TLELCLRLLIRHYDCRLFLRHGNYHGGPTYPRPRVARCCRRVKPRLRSLNVRIRGEGQELGELVALSHFFEQRARSVQATASRQRARCSKKWLSATSSPSS